MAIELIYNDESLLIRAEVRKDHIMLTREGETIEIPFLTVDAGIHRVIAHGKSHRIVAVCDGDTIHVSTMGGDYTFRLPASDDADTAEEAMGGKDKSKLVPPMPGKVVKVLVKPGDTVHPKAKLVIVEAMKMENPIIAPFEAEVVKVNCEEGQLVDTEHTLVELKELDGS